MEEKEYNKALEQLGWIKVPADGLTHSQDVWVTGYSEFLGEIPRNNIDIAWYREGVGFKCADGQPISFTVTHYFPIAQPRLPK